MKKKILVIISLVLIGVIGFQNNWFGLFEKKTAYAVGDLNVVWGVPDGDPIFVVSNMLPGDTEDHDVDVANGGTVPRDVGVRGVKTEEIASFAAVLDFVVSEGGSDLYGGTSPTGPKTLAEFFTESSGPDGIPLSTLGSGNSTTYTFKVTFQESAGNEFQNTNVVFDLKIGISIALPSECDALDLLPTPIIGTSKAENLTGTPGNDLIMGFEGADKINGNGGNDCILGGTGADSINGNNGNDVIFGEGGADSINGNNGNDLLVGGNGADTLRGENGEDHLIGGGDADVLDGGNDNDLLEGGNAADSMRGGNGDDTLRGDAGIDFANTHTVPDTCIAETKIQCEL